MNNQLFHHFKVCITIMTLTSACTFTGCQPALTNEPETIPPHDVVYEFGFNKFSSFKPIYYFLLTLDSAEVKNVILQSDEKSWEHTNTYEVLQAIKTNILDYTSPDNIHKIKGKGALHDVYIANVDDSTKLANMGFSFIDAVHKPSPSHISGNTANTATN